MLFRNGFCTLTLSPPTCLSAHLPLCISQMSPASSRGRGQAGGGEVGSPLCILAPLRPQLSLCPFYTFGGGLATLPPPTAPHRHPWRRAAPIPAPESTHLRWRPRSPSLTETCGLPTLLCSPCPPHACRLPAWSLGRRERRRLHQPDCPPHPNECDHCSTDAPSVLIPAPMTNQPPFLL